MQELCTNHLPIAWRVTTSPIMVMLQWLQRREKGIAGLPQYSQTHYQMEGIKSLLVLGDFVSRLLNGSKDRQMNG